MTHPVATPVLVDKLEMARARAKRNENIARWLLPLISLGLLLGFWHAMVVIYDIKPYLLPSPFAAFASLYNDWGSLYPSLINTLDTTFRALFVATFAGAGLAILFTQSKWVEMVFYPYAVILQVTPMIVVAPLIMIYLDSVEAQLLLCAGIVAFFPMLSNTTLGLKSSDHNLRNLFELYGASRWQTLVHLRIPGALPYFLGGLRIAGGLSLIGAIVAEFVVGAAGKGSGLAFRILEAGYRLQVAKMFAGVMLITLTGITIFLLTNLLSYLLLHRWHESAIKREN